MQPSSGQATTEKPAHLPVLYHEIIHALQPRSGGRYLDCTVGAGGHALSVLHASAPQGRLLGLDFDPQAVQIAGQVLAKYSDRATLVCDSYTNLEKHLADLGWRSVDGLLLDLGVSSMQLDQPGKGFSFTEEGPLDMRFSPQITANAASLVNTLPEKELADLIWQYGEDPHSRIIARAICQARPLHTTGRLREVILDVVKPHPGKIHPATLTFQALRIAVNHELENVEKVLPVAVRVLAPGGRMAIISFHSLEDRLVKQFIRRESQDCICPPRQPACTCGHKAALKDITRHPIRPSEEEIRQNPRARSARLRIAEKL